ncbi:MAG TPA: LysM peptidoglycan-binding domain-containing protein, partial [Stenomitos sp.]
MPSPTLRSYPCTGLQPFNRLKFWPKLGQNRGRNRTAMVLGVCLTLAMPQISQAAAAPINLSCPYRPIMERLQRHTVQSGETLNQIAARYKLLSATLMGMNPAVRNGQAVPGQVLLIPPYNGILVAITPPQTLQSVARVYKVRPDILFEINGCQTAPKTVFVPGVNWSPLNTNTTAAIPLPSQSATLVPADLKEDTYPLPQLASLKRPYGWQANASQDK